MPRPAELDVSDSCIPQNTLFVVLSKSSCLNPYSCDVLRTYFGLGRPGRLPGDIIDQSNWNLEKVRNGNSLPALFDPNFKYGLLTPNIERALSLQRIWKFGLLVP